MPTDPGDYLISYFLCLDRAILATVPFTVTDIGATLSLPTEAVAGSTIQVGWTGPNYDGDYVGIGKVGATGANQWDNFFYTEDGTPSDLLVPTEPGEYRVTYFLGQDRAILESETITVSAVKASITAPETAIGGDTIQITWDGPSYDGDYIGIGKVGATGANHWDNYRYTEDGATLDLLVPVAAGEYEISYFIGQGRDKLFATRINVTEVKARFVAPESGVAGSEFLIGWDGPDYEGDYIGIGPAGATGSAQWSSYAYTENGNPATITLPDEPGDYVIQYFIGQGRTMVGSTALTIE